MAKFHIHKCIFFRTCFIAFKNEVKHYIESILPSKKLFELCKFVHSLMYSYDIVKSPLSILNSFVFVVIELY